jgi:hypothetical protein
MSHRTRTLSVTDAARRFAGVVNRAFYRHETTVLLKNGVAVAYVSPMGPDGIPAQELAHRWPLLPRLSAADADLFADDLAAARADLVPPADPWGIPFGLAEARAHARIWAQLAAAGTLIGAHDMQIAATALVAGSSVATLNVGEFTRVPGLPLSELAPFMSG